MTQIISKDRVKKFGEVFTPQNIVTEMHDKIPKEEWSKIDFTYLEPTCGKGVFIIDAIKRKVEAGLDILTAINTTFGLDIQQDNIDDTRALVEKYVYEVTSDVKIQQEALKLIRHNIICVDALMWMNPEPYKIDKDLLPDWYDPFVYPKGSLIENYPFYEDFKDATN